MGNNLNGILCQIGKNLFTKVAIQAGDNMTIDGDAHTGSMIINAVGALPDGLSYDGDTLTVDGTVAADDPTDDTHLVTKGYADANYGGGGGIYRVLA